MSAEEIKSKQEREEFRQRYVDGLMSFINTIYPELTQDHYEAIESQVKLFWLTARESGINDQRDYSLNNILSRVLAMAELQERK